MAENHPKPPYATGKTSGTSTRRNAIADSIERKGNLFILFLNIYRQYLGIRERLAAHDIENIVIGRTERLRRI